MGSLPPDYSQPWDSAANQYWSKLRVLPYCWNAEESADRLETNVLALTGPGTAFDEEHSSLFKDIPGNTVLLLEVAHSGLHWAAPGDIDCLKLADRLTAGFDGDGFHVGFADGQVWFLSADVPLSEVEKFFTIEGAQKNDREKILGPYARYR